MKRKTMVISSFSLAIFLDLDVVGVSAQASTAGVALQVSFVRWSIGRSAMFLGQACSFPAIALSRRTCILVVSWTRCRETTNAIMNTCVIGA